MDVREVGIGIGTEAGLDSNMLKKSQLRGDGISYPAQFVRSFVRKDC